MIPERKLLGLCWFRRSWGAKFSGVFFALLAGHVAQAASAIDVIKEAANHHPSVLAVRGEVGAAGSEQEASRWQRFPTPSFINQSLRDHARYGGNVNRLAIEQPIFTGGRIDAGIHAADARLSASNHKLDQVTQDLAVRLVAVWFERQRSKMREQTLREGVDAHAKLKQQIERRVAEGVSPIADLTLAVARLSQIRGELAQAQLATRTSNAQLIQLAGEHFSKLERSEFATQLEQAVVNSPPNEWRDLSLRRDPTLKRLSSEIEAASADVDVKRSAFYPNVALRLERDFSGNNDGTRAMVQVSFQPGAGLAISSVVDAAMARRMTALEALRTATAELEQAIDIDYSEYSSALDRLEVANELMRSTEDVAVSYSRQFVAGKKTWLDVLNAVREAVNARLSIQDAKALQGQAWWRFRFRALGFGEERFSHAQ